MSNQIQIFNFNQDTPVRAFLDDDGNPLFVARDVAIALGYSNVNDAISRHCKGVAKHDTLQTSGGTQELRVIYEPDVYRLIFGSKLKSAIKFQNWVFNEVLPSIRKTGSYEVAPVYPMVNIVNPPIPNGAEMYKTFIATVDMRGVMTMRELGKDEFVSTYEDLPNLLRHRSWYVPNEKMAKIAKAALNKITGEWE